MRTTTPTVKIELDKERTLRCDFNALSAFEEQTGLSALEPNVWANPNARTLRALLWSAMLHEDESLTLKSVGAMIHSGNLKYVSEKIREASVAASPAPAEDEPEDERKNANLPTG
jgi:hypothetical protein